MSSRALLPQILPNPTRLAPSQDQSRRVDLGQWGHRRVLEMTTAMLTGNVLTLTKVPNMLQLAKQVARQTVVAAAVAVAAAIAVAVTVAVASSSSSSSS